jgi:hypothetical protein
VGVTGYRIYRCQGSGCTPSVHVATSATNSYPDTGLSPSTAYTYAVSAYDAANKNSSQSAPASATTQAQPTGGLAAYYPFNEGSGATASDSSGNGNTGTLVGPVWTAGNISGALSFDGLDDYVNAGAGPSLNFVSTPITITAWIYPRSYGGGSRGRIADKATSSTGWMFYADNYNLANGLSWIGTGGQGGAQASSTTNIITLNTWQFVAMTVNDSSSVSFYVNGALKRAVANAKPQSSTAPLYIGARSTASDRNFNGTLDDVRIYNYSLSPAEILSLYQTRGYHKSDTSPPYDCVDSNELTAFIARWKVNSSDPTLKELMEAIGLWQRGC